jgi:transposase
VTDLPLAGRVVELLVIARRFRCDAILCGCQNTGDDRDRGMRSEPDRGGGYGEAAAKALPQAVQVADRWHLMENPSRAFLDAGRKSMRQIRTVIGATTIDPKLLTAAERLQYEGYLRREETNAAILALSKHGLPITQIVSQTCHSRKLVRQVIGGERNDVFRTRKSSLDLHLPWLDDQWASGCRNGLNFGAA